MNTGSICRHLMRFFLGRRSDFGASPMADIVMEAHVSNTTDGGGTLEILTLTFGHTFCSTVVRPALLNGTECWVVMKSQEHKMQVVDMHRLQYT